LPGAFSARDLRVRGQRPVDLDSIPRLEFLIGRSGLAEHAHGRVGYVDTLEVRIRRRAPQRIGDRGRSIQMILLGQRALRLGVDHLDEKRIRRQGI